MGYIFGFLVFAILALLSMWETKNGTLKEKIKENYDLQDDNYNLKKKIDDLKEELLVVKKDYDSLEADREELIKELTEYPEENNGLKKKEVKDNES